ncbi:hypothetical protein CEQ90_16580 [Lewinellaceae bacterium SD302]|nr:hypothetical protein CEQ90_16580 [Lewinellaceae bacterium SD302]
MEALKTPLNWYAKDIMQARRFWRELTLSGGIIATLSAKIEISGNYSVPDQMSRVNWEPADAKFQLSEKGPADYYATYRMEMLVEPDEQSWRPFNAVGQLLFLRRVAGKVRIFHASASVVSSRQGSWLVTAAHNVFSDYRPGEPPQWSGHLIYFPGGVKDWRSVDLAHLRHRSYLVTRVGIPKSWMQHTYDVPFEVDFALLKIEPFYPSFDFPELSALNWPSAASGQDVDPKALAIAFPGGEKYRASMWCRTVTVSRQQYVTGYNHLRLHGHPFASGASGGPLVQFDPSLGSCTLIGLHASRRQYQDGVVWWDSPDLSQIRIVG